MGDAARRDPRLEAWVEALVAEPGLTAISDLDEAWRLHVEDALSALPLLPAAGRAVDVGSGGGSPGIPIAAALPDLQVDLLESSRRKCAFLRRVAAAFPNVGVVCARAEEHGRAEGRDAYDVALARALAPPVVAAEWCLPLVRPGGIAVLYAGDAPEGLREVALLLGADPPEEIPVPGAAARRLLVFRKRSPTPERFPRRPGAARKRPLA